jgi:hypothetical protein
VKEWKYPMSHKIDNSKVHICEHDEAPEHLHESPKKTLRQRVKPYTLLVIAIIVVFLFAGIATVLEGYLEPHVFMQYFMAGYFLVFGIMQTISLKKSAKMLQQYDTIAKQVPLYGYLYPPLQIVIGVAYLLWVSPIIVNAVAAVFIFFTLIGVIDVLEQKKVVRCGCLGESMKVSVGWVTLVENGIMFIMASGMLIYFFSTITPAAANTDPAKQQHYHKSL